MAVKLKILAGKIDDDFNKLKNTPFERNQIYYSISIDGKKTSITARKDNRIAYLIDTTHKTSDTYSRLYIEDWRIGVMIAKLDDKSFEFMKNWLASIYRDGSIEECIVKFNRYTMPLGVKAMSVEMLIEMIYEKDVSELSSSIDTTFGFSISNRAFVDFLCLTLSMENDTKLKIAITKHCIIAELLRNRGDVIRSRFTDFKGIKTIMDIEGLYTKMRRQTDIEKYDKKIFSKELAEQYFESFVS